MNSTYVERNFFQYGCHKFVGFESVHELEGEPFSWTFLMSWGLMLSIMEFSKKDYFTCPDVVFLHNFRLFITYIRYGGL